MFDFFKCNFVDSDTPFNFIVAVSFIVTLILMNLSPFLDLALDTAMLLALDDDGNVTSEMEISSQLIQRNDIIRVVPGTKVPTDGIVIKGQSHVNESMIIGEARPIAKRSRDKFIGVTMNESGFLLVKVTHVGSETTLSQIV